MTYSHQQAVLTTAIKTCVAACCAVLLLTACMGGPSKSDSVQQSATRKGGLFGLATTGDVTVETGEAFKGVNEVVIGSFTVGYLTQKTDKAQAKGSVLSSGFGGKSTAHSNLNGISDADLQAITDKAYADFISKLKADGFTIADRSVLLSNEKFASTKDYASPYTDTTGGVFSRGTITKYFAPSSFNGKMKVFMGDIAGFTGGFGFGNPSTVAMEIAEKGGPRILHVTYLVDFANAEAYGGWGRSTSAVTVGQGLTIVPEGTRIGVIGGYAGTFSKKNGSVKLGQPVTSNKEFATVSDATSDAHKVTETAVNVIGVLGGIGSNASRTYEFQARPADYKAAVHDALTDATQAMLAQVKTLR